MTLEEVGYMVTGTAAVIGWIEARVRSITKGKLEIHDQRVTSVENKQDRFADSIDRLGDTILELARSVGRVEGREEKGE